LLSKLRRVFGADAIDGRSDIRLVLEGDIWIDIEVAVEAVHRAESRIALQQWTDAWGPSLVALFVAERSFLPGEEGDWVDEERHHLHEVRLRSLEAHGEAGLEIGGTELPGAVRAGRRLVHLAPLRESGYCLLMRALSRQGNVAEALRVYTDVTAILREELGILPSAPTQAVYEQLLV
jgi:DNA-binding SARP family transcriptional activator